MIAVSEQEFYFYPGNQTLEHYSNGKLLSVSDAGGARYNLAYTAARLSAVEDGFGRRLELTYDPEDGKLLRVTDPAGQAIQYVFMTPLAKGMKEDSRLTGVTYQDGKSKQYLSSPRQLSEPDIYSYLLKGVVDESGIQQSTFVYQGGKAYSTELAGGVNRWTISGSGFKDPLGATTNFFYKTVHGLPLLTSESQPAGSGSAYATNQIEYDADANVIFRVNFNGFKTCYVNDPERTLEVLRVEGLARTVDCATVNGSSAVLPAGARKTTTAWHPDWELPSKVAAPGVVTSNVYNGQPDPFNNNALASCAPVSALLPDGKPIAVLCKQVRQATTDANGSMGFSAPWQAAVPERQTTWTYNQHGQVLTEDGPRTDVADITTYDYYAETTADYTRGDLKQVTDAANKVTRYTKYNKHGQVLESIDANDVVSTNTYDLRQRLLSSSVGGQTSSYTYDAVGQLKRIVLPDTSWIGYDYDDAHRQVAVYDHKGNRISYTLDNAGNRTGEDVKDPGGVLARQLTRTIDALGRIQQTTGRE